MDRKNIYIVILMMTTIIAACCAIYFCINPISKNEVVSDENNNEITFYDTKDDTTNSTNTEDTINSNTKVEEDVAIRTEIDISKCLNAQENMVYNAYRSASSTYCSCYLVSSDLVEVMFDKIDELKQNYGIDNIDVTAGTRLKISNFNNKKVVDVYIYGMGQAIGQEIIYFLMEDGTVEYMPIRKALANNDIRSYGKINVLSNIIEIVEGSANSVNGPGYYTPFAITKDGSCYELSPLVSSLLN